MKNFDGYATLLFGILIGLALGVVVGMWSPEISHPFWTDPECTGPVWYCLVYSWQTLVAGSFAIGAAALAWTATKRQIAAQSDLHHEAIVTDLKRAIRAFEEMKFQAETYLKAFNRLKARPEQLEVDVRLFKSCQAPRIPVDLWFDKYLSVRSLTVRSGTNAVMDVYQERVMKIGKPAPRPGFFSIDEEEALFVDSNSETMTKNLSFLRDALEDDIRKLNEEIEFHRLQKSHT